MKLDTSYKQILTISLPIMLGSAAQNIIVLSDSFFLVRNDSLDFAAIGLVGIFYLLVASIGYGFSRGGQVLMARRYGERNDRGLGRYFQSLVIFELIIALIIFASIHLFAPSFFKSITRDPEIYKRCIEYLIPRSYGIFFSYLGVSIIALYTSIARTKFIVIDTVILTVTNLVLDYILIFGAFGVESMGVKGAAIASTIAEIVAFVSFVIYMFYDKKIRPFQLLHFSKLPFDRISETFRISMPIVFQSMLGLGVWFIFFAWIENRSSHELEVSNLIRNLYLILSIPCWGFSAGINTLVSNFIGNNKRFAVVPIIKKTAILSTVVTLALSMVILFFPFQILTPLVGRENLVIIQSAIPLLPLLVFILIAFNLGGIYMNGLIGTGHTVTALWIQFIFSMVYLVYSYYVIKVWNLSLNAAWFSEAIYWIGIGIMVAIYLNSKKWYERKF
ncbi:MAG TPA: MATE family efflux transporter [Saprospiraceae bacterium]|nr:MATE family efflux transporter [Saprospiraceae bacterium]MCB9328459.1 MATE family efflux transporter [Lewinellaceae bacterium]HPK10132.1 MATE family efflux transporter [Saprospiraceae bacterium]HPQ21076.1 MATE family efflux transporter [Saprospiraceae bacterium]HRX28105.1 MATE family efflux transporter [Saprospiraceae bacterium]